MGRGSGDARDMRLLLGPISFMFMHSGVGSPFWKSWIRHCRQKKTLRNNDSVGNVFNPIKRLKPETLIIYPEKEDIF